MSTKHQLQQIGMILFKLSNAFQLLDVTQMIKGF